MDKKLRWLEFAFIKAWRREPDATITRRIRKFVIAHGFEVWHLAYLHNEMRSIIGINNRWYGE